jgi:hypothetical protein
MSAGMIASVSGIFMRTVVPVPGFDCTSTVPPIFSMLVLTTSMPTPRPETLVTFSAVENPGRKIRFTPSRSPMRAACSGVIRPFSTALRRILSPSRPPPSSEISMMTWPPSWYARSSRRPSAGLPTATRLSGFSMPWSTELRTMCVSGSLMASTIVLSSSVSLPSISMRTCLPHIVATSRTVRGNLLQMLPIGCMRVFITPSCSSVVMRLSRWLGASRPASSVAFENCRIWLRARTSSPTRFISLSSRVTSTRIELSLAAVRDCDWAPASAVGAGP